MKVWIILHDHGDGGFSTVAEVLEDCPQATALARLHRRIEASGHHDGEDVHPDLLASGEWVYGRPWSSWLLTRRQTTPGKDVL